MKKINFSFTLVIISLFTILPAKIFAQWNQPQWVVDSYEPFVYDFIYNGSEEALAYRLLRPINFDESQNYPVVITLHGASGFNKVNANDYNINSLRYINQEFAKDSIRLAHPTYVICLQGIKFADGSSDMWNKKHLAGVKQIIDNLPNADLNKIYVMGQSAGGFGTYRFIWYDPEYFAAAIATSADGFKISDTNRDKLINFNLWTMHGDTDGTIPYEGDLDLFNYMKARNATMKFTTFIRRGHSTEAFLVGNYAAEGIVSVVDTDRNTGVSETKTYDYKTEYASENSDREPNTLNWLFSKSNKKSLGLNDYNLLDVSLYPNPTNSIINWSPIVTTNKVVVYDISGKVLMKKTELNSNRINISMLTNGIYFINFYQKDNTVFTKKIIKN